MKLRAALFFHLPGLGFLRCASLLVPARQRLEWWSEWRSELWHVRQACTPERGVSWTAEREVAAFCLGAFQDVLCLREHSGARRMPPATATGSAAQCILLLASLLVASYGLALLLPGVSAILHPSGYRDAQNLMLIRDSDHSGDSTPTISAAQYQFWKLRKQELFENFAFYQVRREFVSSPSHSKAVLGVAHASVNLFQLLGLPVRLASGEDKTRSDMPRVILSDEVWKTKYGGDPHISGRRIRVGRVAAVVEGVVRQRAWKLPGTIDVWLLEPDTKIVSDNVGFVVARLTSSAAHDRYSDRWGMTAQKPDGSSSDFLCISLANQTRGPWGIFLFAVVLACLALPATTSLPLGEYRSSSRKLSWPMRLRRWSFLSAKIALLLPIIYFVSLDLSYLRTNLDALSSEYIQLISSFSICLFGLRWILRDQRQRCPVCLRKLTHPARVGQPSRNFLAWNGTELICVGGHGLLHVPEISTSWFSEQRWLYLDPSWEVLFTEPGLPSGGYF